MKGKRTPIQLFNISDQVVNKSTSSEESWEKFSGLVEVIDLSQYWMWSDFIVPNNSD